MATTKWDLTDFIDSKKDVIANIEAALEENDPEYLFEVIGALARSKDMTEIAKELNVTRESLYRSISPDGNPSFATVIKLLDVLGLQLSVKQKIA
ncbi:putative addiction module antidote protein [Treponema primitia]|uniref:addiction module antidote protein n=1 Tax=Treponema primitia TaxID=88058 RepID=UPI00397F188C